MKPEELRFLADQLAGLQSRLLRRLSEDYALLERLGTLHANLMTYARQTEAFICPQCGSPKSKNLTGMGTQNERQCADCGEVYAA